MNKRLYISGLTAKATDSSLLALFSRAGTVELAEVAIDREDGNKVKGFGFVVMSTENEAARAISLFDGMIYEGRSITVYEARPKIVRNRPVPTEDSLATS